MHIATSKALLSAIIRSKKPITFLVGSPMSSRETPQSRGVASVSEIVLMIENLIKKEGLFDIYSEEITTKNTTDLYQEGFDFLKNYLSQDDVNDIIHEAVLKAYDEKDGWHIPSGLDALCKTISENNLKVQSIITTNFDPLIEEGLKKYGMTPLKTILHTDGSINNHSNEVPKGIQVIHLHGFWKDSDTLHTPKQLTSNRPKLKHSLLNILRDTTLVVIAYGGWDDIFIDSLKDISFDSTANIDVIWAFYENDEEIVNKKYSKLLSGVESISQRGRFRQYYSIECNEFFSQLNIQLNISEHEKENGEVIKKTSSGVYFDQVTEEIKKTALNNKEKGFNFEPMNLKRYPAHINIRLVEQTQFFDEIKRNRVVSIVADWGMERNGFLYSLISNKNNFFSDRKIFNINLEGCKNIEEIDDRFKDRFGLGIHNLIILDTESVGVIILLEGLSSLEDSSWSNEVTKLINVLLDFAPDILIINSGNSSLINLTYPVLALKALSEPDIKTFLLEHQEGDSEYVTQSYFDSIVRISGGLPTRLNNILLELKIRGIDSLIEDENNQKIDLDEFQEDDPIPIKLKEALLNYVNLSSETRHFSLLKILSTLQYGETFTRLRRFYPKSPFTTSDFLELTAVGLITTSEKVYVLTDKGKSEIEPVHVINPLVGIYIRQATEKEEYFSILKKCLDITFGDMWINGDIKFNPSSLRHLQDVNKSGPGNTHILICSFIRYVVENDMRREIKASFNLALAFFKFLEDNERYKDLVFSATEVKAIIKDSSESVPLGRLHYSLSKGLRMLGYRLQAIDEMLLALNYPSLFKKDELSNCKLHIALAYSSQGHEEEAISYANQVKKSSKSDSASYTQAELILAEFSPSEVKIQQLRKVQRKAERLGFKVIKSQAILAIAKNQKGNEENIKLYNNALTNLTDKYSIYSVIIARNLYYIEKGLAGEISESDINTLCIAYSYFYTQRLDIQLEKTHRILWAVFVDKKDSESLVKLFRYSSFIWRLNNDSANEEKYANLLNIIIELNLTDSYIYELIKYAKVRIKLLKDSLT